MADERACQGACSGCLSRLCNDDVVISQPDIAPSVSGVMIYAMTAKLPPLACAVLLLAACSRSDEPAPVAVALEHIDCAVGGEPELKPACSVERVEKDGALTLVVHHPDGGYRRFAVAKGGAGVTTKDSATPPKVRLAGDRLDVTVGTDRYLFPATVKHDAPR